MVYVNVSTTEKNLITTNYLLEQVSFPNIFLFYEFRTPRNKRQAETGNEGSGEDDYDDEYYDSDDEYVRINVLFCEFRFFI